MTNNDYHEQGVVKILLTGASGFLGKVVLKTAQQRGLTIRPIYRSIDLVKGQPDSMIVSGLDGTSDWSQALQNVTVVIHSAARAHIMRDEAFDPLTEYRLINVEGTLNLARQAAAVGVRRFIFISSIKVNGESTALGCPFTADDVPAPIDAYGQSKNEAEEQLMQVALETGMEVTIIRSPLIYGPGVKGNLASLVKWVRLGIPLPLGAVTHNRRSLVCVDNLVDLILICVFHPNAANQTFLVSDGVDVSTAELLRKIGKSLGRTVHLFPFPPLLITFLAGLMGKRVISQRLLGSLQVDIKKTCNLLDWRPSVAMEEGLRKAME
jgi:nucleoside-diphosphate-sugar epimerase